MVEPEKNLKIQFHQLEVGADRKIHFNVSVEMLLDVFGRLSQWVRDVQMISLSANADATCRLNIRGTVAFQLNPLKFPPDVQIKPHVDDASVEIAQFKVRRISHSVGHSLNSWAMDSDAPWRTNSKRATSVCLKK